ncbi:hypothetical protein [Streptomyces aurantiacus]|uniref:Uncharacterized protein n=1 Tax=Streptomyces aurantiacus TaxID=47760 RepID=A0A7G1NU48_9ACTN|nr:hypothetical protein [Streptomyces aurantiacus]BCL25147.1 hypothetical protein GCM10017557_00060 [Streptomyces aurantiacus]
MRLLQLRTLTGIHLTLVCHRPHLPAALHQALQTADYCVTADFQAARRHYYGTPAAVSPLVDEPARSANRWLTLPVLDRLVSYDSPAPCTAPCTPPAIAFRHRPPPAPLTEQQSEVARRLATVTATPAWSQPLLPRSSPVSPSSSSPPPVLATTTTPRPLWPCMTALATPTAAPLTACRRGRVSS